MSDFGNVFEGKTVLVTGDTGFKGPWLCLWLLELGAKVIGYALPSENSSLFRRLSLDENMTHVNGDIRDAQRVQDTIHQYKPEFVFHLAAQSLVRPSYKDPLGTFSTNIQGTLNVLEAVRREGIARVIINVTTDKVYLNREWAYSYRENDPLGGTDPYSVSKACADLVTLVYQQGDFMGQGTGVATARAGNVFGGGDWAEDRIVPDIVRAYQRKMPVNLRNPQSVRPWQYVLEPLSGYLALASRLYDAPDQYRGAWNFGPAVGNMLTVKQFVDRFLKYLPGVTVLMDGNAGGPKEANLLRLDWTKSSSELGWQPALTLDEGLEYTAEWYLGELEGLTSLPMAVDYIHRYAAIARSRSISWTL